MGIRVNGYEEELYTLSTPIRVITLITLVSTLTGSLFMIYLIAWRNYVGKMRYARLLIVLFLICTIHQIMTLLFLFLNTPAILDWFLSVVGGFLITGLGISTAELLYFFAPLTTFWNKRRVRILQVFWLLFSAYCYIDVYLKLGYIGREMPDWEFRFWLPHGLGLSATLVIGSLYYIFQSFWILSLLYRHIRVTRKETLQLRIRKMIQFVVLMMGVVLIDTLGTALYAIGPYFANEERAVWTLGACVLYIHVIWVCIIFKQLKYITIVGDAEISGEEKPNIIPLVKAKQAGAKTELKGDAFTLNTVRISRSMQVSS